MMTEQFYTEYQTDCKSGFVYTLEQWVRLKMKGANISMIKDTIKSLKLRIRVDLHLGVVKNDILSPQIKYNKNIKNRLAIVIATYQRPDGKTPFYLNRTLASIDVQTFRNYRVYVVGDAYENEEELREVVARYPRTICHNLKESPERKRYGFRNMKIWSAGGVTAANTGIAMALEDGIEYICHQGHDDTWEPNHLETISNVIKLHRPIFICTLSTYGGRAYPPLVETDEVLPFYPIDGGIIASSACVKYSDTKLRVVDRFATEGIVSPADAYLWECLRNEMKATGKKGYIVTTLTCHHDEEGYAIRGH